MEWFILMKQNELSKNKIRRTIFDLVDEGQNGI